MLSEGAKIYLRPNQLLDNPERDVFDEIIEKTKNDNHKKEENDSETLNTGQTMYSPMEIKISDFVKNNPKTLGRVTGHLNCGDRCYGYLQTETKST